MALSTTPVATGSIMGSGLTGPKGKVRWSVAARMVLAWVTTLPARRWPPGRPPTGVSSSPPSSPPRRILAWFFFALTALAVVAGVLLVARERIAYFFF